MPADRLRSSLKRSGERLYISTSRPNIPPAETHVTPSKDSNTPAPAPLQRSKLAAYLALTRFHAPVGSTLLFLPCAQSTLLAGVLTHADPPSTLKLLALFGTGAFVMRSAGCVINDLWDRNLDKKVSRTALRPIASGELSVIEGIVFLGGLLSLGLGVLTQLNVYSIILGASSMSLVIVYPLMKRVTYLPQLVLGLAFNWGALLGYPALVGTQDWSAVLPLYASGICWTMIYDTIYAHQDISDDRKVGIKSTALLFGDNTKPILSMLSVGQFGALAYIGSAFELGAGFWAGSAAALFYTARMVYLLDIKDIPGCGAWFRKSQYVGWLIAAGLGLEYSRELLGEQEQEPELVR
ncbi:protein of unknown function [Taphrina deformans PYCC 5710]|uniref:4-hydroxybenzoate polyprenyltransferase, mitochondrial n=1 Tax=Taphrina deformans (strain PYCC 5710 / ATCC 11124 / CBS 356.35 / IMI 108563 / JCM 9778 / NBRC 8474) TaxID=1097556 RepID=R4XGW4_TAPDE|nr:protein of unknown function [Taphrina deformans PYCC 5710]|eukprot:CCG84933.1 protein of unknown function [Taphrina deformans PYCC 5710]